MTQNYETTTNNDDKVVFHTKTIIEIFEEQVLKSPLNVAIVFNGHKVTYERLNQKVNQLSHYLLSKHVEKEDLVGICIERSIEMIIGILAIAKAGAAYLPIDPAAPRDRIGYMLKDAKSPFVISTTDLSQLVGGFDNTTPIYLDLIAEELGQLPDTNPNVSITPENLLYVIYTSGSTGNPKGVLIEHRNVVRLFFNDAPLFKFTENDVWTMFHSFNFDFSVWEMFGALLFGGKLLVVGKETAKDPSGFYELMRGEGVTVLNQTPSAFNVLQDVILQKEPLEKLRYVIFGGEALYPSILKKWNEVYLWSELINMYGITETTVHVTYKKITDKEIASNLSDIGKPIPTLSAIILDEQLKPVQTGIVGELCVGGEGLARGYLNRADLTAEKFINNPFEDGKRLYRSGDLARVLADGNLEYIGRRDNQVKIRGYRIELGEVESRIQEIDGVHQAVVVAKERNAEKYLVAYFTKSDATTDHTIIRNKLLDILPGYMIPDFIIELAAIPLTTNGKVDKKALPEPDEKIVRKNLFVAPVSDMERKLADSWMKLLGFAKVGVDDNFFELGGNSLLAQKLVNSLKREYNFDVPITKVYQNPTIAGLQKFLNGEKRKIHTPQKKADIPPSADIAVIGMECIFPGANGTQAFWELLKSGKEATRFFSSDELDRNIPDDIRHSPSYVKARGVLDNVEFFDAEFFGISPRLAELMDPQHRLFLETSRNLLEKTGYLPEKKESVTSVFAGCSTNTYFNNNVVWHRDKIALQGSVPVISVSDKDYISSRVSYQLNLSGPAVNVNTACSTSLVAIIQAVESLRAGQCDTAIAGGAAITAPVNSGHLYEEGSMLSEDGHCRPFDAHAKGTVFSDGVGAVLLKRLDDAKKDGDIIYAVIKGVGINNDGGHKGSFTAPSAEGQASAITMAFSDAAVKPEQISYIEAHGTATPLGDPIEIDGLKLAFGKQEKKQFCGIGSVKSNFGHLTHAAGVAGFIKTVLALYHKQIPPSINYTRPNPQIDFDSSPFKVNDRLRSWDTEDKRIAGVSSFGVGGTNAHVVLEEYAVDSQAASQDAINKRVEELICWSAHKPDSQIAYTRKLNDFLLANPGCRLQDIAYTLNVSRQDLGIRSFVVAKDIKELMDQTVNTELITAGIHVIKEKKNNIVFLFPGQGNQYPNMGKELYDKEPVYRKAIDDCAVILQHYMAEDIREIIFVETADDNAIEKLKNTRYAQPALFITSYALAQLYKSWGIVPAAYAGHSVGEFVGAHLAGIFSLPDVLKIVSERGRMISELPAGTMLSVRASEEKIRTLLPPQLSIAAQNAAELCVVSGENLYIESFAAELTRAGIINKPLRTSHAFHSSMMDPAVEKLQTVVESTTMRVPQIPVMSTVTAQWLKDGEATDASYWAQHARKTVQFGEALKNIQIDLNPIFLEAGPGSSSTVFARQNGVGEVAFAVLSNTTTSETVAAKTALGKLWQFGADIDWKQFYDRRGAVLLHDLPTYAFNRKKLWVDPPVQNSFAVQQPETVLSTTPEKTTSPTNNMKRKDILLAKLKDIIESASGISVADANPQNNFTELGLDSLLLTQLTTSLKKEFSVPVTFRQLSEDYDTLNKLSDFFDEKLPAEMFAATVVPQSSTLASTVVMPTYQLSPANGLAPAGNDMLGLITQQLQILTQQVAIMQGGTTMVNGSPAGDNIVQSHKSAVLTKDSTVTDDLTAEERVELKKPFGATARIEKKTTEISEAQKKYISDFIKAYNKKTEESKRYTQRHRAKMADPRVVSGFKPYTKEMVYSIVAKQSKGCYLWDIDGNKYIDALNGFGSNFLGYQPDFIKEAILKQVEDGYEIGPQHFLAGEVADLVCELTGMERAALCNTGSEAVLGAMRIVRTVTGKDIVVAFTGSYHGIMDEVLVRGSKKLKTYPAASGILSDNVQNMLILEYGTEESLNIIRERASEIAAVLVEPVQSRRPEFQPVEFLKDLRKLTAEADVALIFDEVITGFRSHLGGIQALFGIQADLATYGKVAGAGISIGIIAGDKKYMDALDGGYWEYGDDSIPEIGVTYFAGTFVRHPLALAATKASLEFLKSQGPGLQKEMNEKTDRLVQQLNQIAEKHRVPIYIVHFSSLWKIKFRDEYPYYELLFALMRLRNIHIWDLFPCFLTLAHTQEDITAICVAFEESIEELCKAGFIPQVGPIANSGIDVEAGILDNSKPPVPGAKLGKDKNGNPAWFAPDDSNPGKYLQISLNGK